MSLFIFRRMQYGFAVPFGHIQLAAVPIPGCDGISQNIHAFFWIISAWWADSQESSSDIQQLFLPWVRGSV